MKMPATWILIIFLIIIIILQRACGNKCQTPQIRVDTTYITVHDTIENKIPIPFWIEKEGKSYPVTKTDTEFITLEQYVDTAKILSDYFATRFYKDISKTKYGNITILDSVTQNKIKSRSILTDFVIPEPHSITLVSESKRQFYVGFLLGSNGQALGFGPDILYKTKKDAIYNIGVAYMPGQNLFYHGSMFWKIHF